MSKHEETWRDQLVIFALLMGACIGFMSGFQAGRGFAPQAQNTAAGIAAETSR